MKKKISRARPTRRVALDPPFGPNCYLLVDEEAREYNSRDHSATEPQMRDGVLFRKVSLMSTPAGGEVRGYFLSSQGLYLQLPCDHPDWVQADRAVSRACAADIVRGEG